MLFHSVRTGGVRPAWLCASLAAALALLFVAEAADGSTRSHALRYWTPQRMQGCNSSYRGDDRLAFTFPGPPTLGIGCHWAPGASGGGWLVEGGTRIDGLNSYLHLGDRSRTYGPYFSQETVGKLAAGL